MKTSSKIKLVFAGSPHISAKILESLIPNKDFDLKLVISQPPKRKKRGALKTDQYGTINYELEKVNDIDCASNSHCVLSTSGTLTIIGNKKPVDLSFDVILSGNKAVFIGTYSLKMSEYNIDPPTALFGTITTGDELHIRFKTIFSK